MRLVSLDLLSILELLDGFLHCLAIFIFLWILIHIEVVVDIRLLVVELANEIPFKVEKIDGWEDQVTSNVASKDESADHGKHLDMSECWQHMNLYLLRRHFKGDLESVWIVECILIRW